MAGLADGIGRWTDWVHYRAVAKVCRAAHSHPHLGHGYLTS